MEQLYGKDNWPSWKDNWPSWKDNWPSRKTSLETILEIWAQSGKKPSTKLRPYTAFPFYCMQRSQPKRRRGRKRDERTIKILSISGTIPEGISCIYCIYWETGGSHCVGQLVKHLGRPVASGGLTYVQTTRTEESTYYTEVGVAGRGAILLCQLPPDNVARRLLIPMRSVSSHRHATATNF